MDDDSDGEIVLEFESEPDKVQKELVVKDLLGVLVHLYLLILHQVAHQEQPPVREALSVMLKMTLTYQTPHWQRIPQENEKVF